MTTLKVKGMTCNACETLVKEALEENGANEVFANFKKEQVKFNNLNPEKATKIIQGEGYQVVR